MKHAQIGILAASSTGLTPIFDTYPGFWGISLFKLRSAYSGFCFNARESVGNTSSNIGFSGNYFNTTSYNSFIGAGNGFMTKWYDQMSTGLDPLQGTAGQQPQIIANAIPGLSTSNFVQSNNKVLSITSMDISAALSGTLKNFSIFLVYRTNNQAQSFQTPFIINSVDSAVPFTGALYNPSGGTSYSFAERTDSNVGNTLSATADFSSFCCVTLIFDTHIRAYKNGVSLGTPVARVNSSITINRFQVGGGDPSLNITGDLMESLVYQSSQVSNLSAIVNNQKLRYGIA